MTDEFTITEPQADTRVAELLGERERINGELAKLSPRPLYYCLRCGYSWHGHNIARPPQACARCHTAGWDRPPSHRDARRPSDAPNPKWREKVGRKRKGNRTKLSTMEAELRRAELSMLESKRVAQIEGTSSAEMPTAFTPPPSLQRGLTPPPRIQLASQFAHRVEPEPLPEQISSHNVESEPESPEEVVVDAQDAEPTD